VFTQTRTAVVDCLAGYTVAVEVGIGSRPDVACDLAERGVRVTATDVHQQSPPEGVRFVCDDVTDPTFSLYRPADVLYALNCPPELQRPLADLATRVGADCVFTTLGTDPAVIPATPETLPDETLFTATARTSPSDGSGNHRGVNIHE
jgi:uncharacterized UPF0146 family protein